MYVCTRKMYTIKRKTLCMSDVNLHKRNNFYTNNRICCTLYECLTLFANHVGIFNSRTTYNTKHLYFMNNRTISNEQKYKNVCQPLNSNPLRISKYQPY